MVTPATSNHIAARNCSGLGLQVLAHAFGAVATASTPLSRGFLMAEQVWQQILTRGQDVSTVLQQHAPTFSKAV